MALYGSARDASLLRHINRELIYDFIDTEIAFYKLSLDDTKAKMYDEAFKDCNYIIPQKVLPGHTNTYWTYTVKYKGDNWFNLYNKVKEAGGDGFYGGLSVPYHEPIMENYNYKKGDCPNAESTQPKMMQFKTNYRDLLVAQEKINILKEVINNLE